MKSRNNCPLDADELSEILMPYAKEGGKSFIRYDCDENDPINKSKLQSEKILKYAAIVNEIRKKTMLKMPNPNLRILQKTADSVTSYAIPLCIIEQISALTPYDRLCFFSQKLMKFQPLPLLIE